MKSQLFDETPKSVKTSTGRWVHILPDKGEGYLLYDPLAEMHLGRILMDAQENWIYDGSLLTVTESEELAGAITGYRKEMDELLRVL